ncbi:MAG: hypothetical protein ACOYM9_11175 [Bradymonadia bacterium]|jgi:hypothetical protein
MKATIELDDALYRQLKAAAALQGRKVKELVAEGVRRVLEQPIVDAMQGADTPEPLAVPRWFGSLQAYAQNAAGNHDLDSMRRSVARGRTRQSE